MSLLTLPEPDAAVLARRDEIVRQLKKLVAAPGLIVDREGCRTFETDALTAYRCVPLAVVLPASTEEVSRVLRFCHDTKLKVVPRGAGTSLCGGALPLEDAIVLGISRMSKVLAIDVTNRAARVEAGVTNIAISNAVAAEGFFYAPDPSSQLACTLGGNIAMNAGGAHCLKYGVTTNNVLGLRVVLMSGEIVEIGGDHLDAAGYDFLGLIIGSEGQLGIVTEATVRLLKAPEGARPMLLGFSSSEAAGACVAAIIAAGITAKAALTFSADLKNHRWSGSNAFTTPTLVTNTARPHSKINTFLSFPSHCEHTVRRENFQRSTEGLSCTLED